MAQTHYIEVDEEIISAVGRLRKTAEAENVFVFPKRALILQSIVNLKLLEREAKKLGKKIIVVTQDSAGKILAEKAGLSTQEYREETLREPAPVAHFTVEHHRPETLPQNESQEAPQVPRASSLGSSEFFGSQQTGEPPKIPQVVPLPSASKVAGPETRTLRVRNMTPPRQTSLNSMRPQGLSERPLPPSKPVQPLPQKFVPQANHPLPPLLQNSEGMLPPRQEKLRRFMSGAREHFAPPQPPGRVPRAVEKVPAIKPEVYSSHLAKWSFVGLGVFSALAIVGAVLFIVLAKAVVTVIPQGSSQDVTYQFTGTKNSISENGASHSVPARVVDQEKAINLSIPSTGANAGEAGKAHGTVILSNAFSRDAQPLVATTRLETTDGKIFRLTQGATVPGMNGTQPGIIEVSVIADQAGEEYNVGPSTFTIPGFRGGPKFEKFSGKSTQAMTGGSSADGNGPKTVTTNDLDTAKTKALDEARANFKNDVLAELQPGEKLFEESVEVSLVGAPTAPPVGSATESFAYGARVRVRAFVVSEQSMRDFIETQSVKSNEASPVVLKPVNYSLVYGTPLSNFDAAKVDFSVQAELQLRAPVNTETLRQELLGKNQSGIESVLGKHPEIKSLQVEFQPSFFISSIPTNPTRVTVNVSEITQEQLSH